MSSSRTYVYYEIEIKKTIKKNKKTITSFFKYVKTNKDFINDSSHFL